MKIQRYYIRKIILPVRQLRFETRIRWSDGSQKLPALILTKQRTQNTFNTTTTNYKLITKKESYNYASISSVVNS